MTRGVSVLTQVHRETPEAETRPLSLRLIRRLFTFTRPHRHTRNTLLVLVLIRAMQLPALAWLIGRVIGGPISGLDPVGLAIGAAGYGLLALLTQWTFYYRSLYALTLGEGVICDLRKALFRHLQRLPMSFFQDTRLGRVISRFSSDSEAVRAGVQNVLFMSLVQAGQMLFAAAVMAWYDWFLFLIIVLMSPGIWLLTDYFRRQLSRAYRAVQESFSRVTATLAESVGGIRVTQGFVREEKNAGLFFDLVADHSRFNLDAARAAGVFIPMLEFSTQVFVALVLLVGGRRVLQGQMEVEHLYQFILMSGLFFGPIQALGSHYNQALTAMAGAERVFHLLDTPPLWTDPPDAADAAEVRGRIEFRNVAFGYVPGRPVLRNVSFVAEPGQTVALVGHTGSGKTTIINLISKFYLPNSGDLLVDGRDIRMIRTASLQRRMGIVLQENFLFTGTVLDNIRYGKPDATREQVVQAARKLDCLDLIAELPDGFNTRVGERGAGISLGQRQLICFTRALLADPRILILDEATSSVDTLTEARIQKSLATLLADRTSFVVAHRLSTIRHADLVLVLAGGEIVERGRHETLLAHGGLYTELYRQFIRSADGGQPADPLDSVRHPC
ncbi:MAG: ABC transporter ATP-binding protein [Kiritimatiellae bacterium]|nr:ABC transporter ATP-binding protein [Kiritimatiellia bacterium]